MIPKKNTLGLPRLNSLTFDFLDSHLTDPSDTLDTLVSLDTQQTDSTNPFTVEKTENQQQIDKKNYKNEALKPRSVNLGFESK